jgi:hypothetical protein
LTFNSLLSHSAAMPKRSSTNKGRTRDGGQLAKSIVDLATGNPIVEEPQPVKDKDPLAVELGRRGGLKGGKARAEKLSDERRKEIAKKAAEVRWSNRPLK